ncbi:GNAT family N-acetyltransferase [Ramlibacter sp. PS3R-8]|uniref:GNAT family N-acetyltransferase n=1 Tax=Ramlibacter sp. PS3R-8 TaxID=3133437 RepID=UPI0030A3A9B1
MADVLRIQDSCYVDIEPEARESLQAKILASPSTCLVAEIAGDVVGYLIAAPILYPDLPELNAPTFQLAANADTLYLHDLAIANAARGTRAGRALVRAAMEVAKEGDLTGACLVAIQGSVRYWEQLGFEIVEAPPDGVAAKLASYGAAARLMRAAL